MGRWDELAGSRVGEVPRRCCESDKDEDEDEGCKGRRAWLERGGGRGELGYAMPPEAERVRQRGLRAGPAHTVAVVARAAEAGCRTGRGQMGWLGGTILRASRMRGASSGTRKNASAIICQALRDGESLRTSPEQGKCQAKYRPTWRQKFFCTGVSSARCDSLSNA